MSTDRQRNKANTSARTPPTKPLMPRLAATANSNKNTPSPKLASRFSPSATAQTTRRPLVVANTNAPNARRPPESASTPIKNLNPNVTPRSVPRQSRPTSSSSTPNAVSHSTVEPKKPTHLHAPGGTANPRRTSIGGQSSGGFDVKNFISAGVTANSRSPPEAKRPLVSPSVTAASTSLSTPAFFHANDTPTTKPTPQRPPLRKKSSSFMYANDAHEFDQSLAANGINHDLRYRAPLGESPLPSTAPAGTGPVSPAASAPAPLGLSVSPQPPSFLFQSLSSQFFRPPSPSKDNIHLSYRKGASQVIRPVSQSTNYNMGLKPEENGTNRQISLDLGEELQPPPIRRGSGDSSLPGMSNGTLGGKATTSDPKLGDYNPIGSPVRHFRGNSVPHISSFPRSPPSIDDPLRSPTASATGESDSKYFSDLAANARRERKVLDLQISNSSLLAINKSLEREVRRQKVELRRLRRQSRNRHTSFGSDVISSSQSDRLADLPEQENESYDGSDGMSELSEEDDSLDEEFMSPHEIAANDERHRLRDAKRLQLDLSKHKELLLDSQKMNQSLKRCLGMTDHLIMECGKALQYKVNISDIDFGGRVLSHYDHELERQGQHVFDLQHSDTVEELIEDVVEDPMSNPALGALSLEPNRNWIDNDSGDRDSGVDVEYSRRIDGSTDSRKEEPDTAPFPVHNGFRPEGLIRSSMLDQT